MNDKRSVSLTVKIVGMAVACIIITMIASQMFSTNVSTNYVLNTAKTSLSSLSIAKGNDLEQYISAQKTFTHTIANNGEVIKACQEYKSTGKFDTQL